MSHSVISLGLGLGGGKSATSSGRPAGGSPYANLLSASFDGTDDILDCGDDSSLEPVNLTVSAWFKATGSIGGLNYIVSKLGAYYGTFHLRYTNSNKFNIFLSVGASSIKQVNSTSTYTLTNWNHVAFTYDKQNLKLYVNGSLDGSTASTDDIQYAINPASPYAGKTLAIGKMAGPFPDPAEGLIDEVSYFGSALSASNISSMYNSGTPTDISELNPISWWRMGDGTGDTNSSGGTPSNGESIGTIKDQIGDNDATQSTASNKPTFSNTVPS